MITQLLYRGVDPEGPVPGSFYTILIVCILFYIWRKSVADERKTTSEKEKTSSQILGETQNSCSSENEGI